jgi:hypothetical protein
MISKAFSSDEGNNDREEDITVLRRIWIVKRDYGCGLIFWSGTEGRVIFTGLWITCPSALKFFKLVVVSEAPERQKVSFIA